MSSDTHKSHCDIARLQLHSTAKQSYMMSS